MSPVRNATAALSGALAICLAVPAALAADNDAQLQVAQQHVKLGEVQFRAKGYLDAAKSFEAAIAAMDKAGEPPPPGMYRSLARSYDLAAKSRRRSRPTGSSSPRRTPRTHAWPRRSRTPAARCSATNRAA